MTKEQFIEKARKIHGDKFDYSKVEYVDNNTEVIIICPIHGEFKQTPSAHLKSIHGCKKCGCVSGNGKQTENARKSFIEKAKKIHNNKFDYSKVEYVNNHTPVCIICPEHGEFFQTPQSHLHSNGCKKCSFEKMGKEKVLSNEQFLKMAKSVHGERYDLSKVQYTGRRNKITVICPKHGEFKILAGNFLQGGGCKKCANEEQGNRRRGNTVDFVAKLKKIYGDYYDYSLVSYNDCNTPVKLICPKHGEFSATPNNLLQGHACKKCGKESYSEKTKHTIEQFIEKARKIHGDKYDYSQSVYLGARKDITVICPEHGPFTQRASAHLLGQGCPKCADNQKIDKEEFIRRAREIHGDKYNYSKVDYINNYTKVIITCPEHGDFEQLPHSHLKGNGCRKCYDDPLLEREVFELLKKNCILFVQQKTFDELKDKRKLKFDFYLPEYNVAIECQGIEHYKPIEFFGGVEAYNDRVKKDKMKIDFCKEHGIKLIHYSHLSKIKTDYPVIHTKKKLLTEINDKDL